MAARHPDIIKIWVDDFFGATEPKMPPEIYGAVIDEAHKHGLRVAAHIFHLEDAKSLLRDGLDVIAHSVRDKPVDQEFIDLMKKNRAGYIATLTLDEAQFVYAEHPAWMDTAAFRSAVEPNVRETWLTAEYVSKIKRSPLTRLNKAALAQGMNNVKLLYDAGVLVGFGTDSGATPTRLPGWAEHRELQLLVEAGLSPMEAIQCATRNAADVLGDLKNRGTLEPGKRADFLILDADPPPISKYHAARGGLSWRQARRAQVSRRIHTKYIARAMNPHLCRTWVPRRDWCDGRPRDRSRRRRGGNRRRRPWPDFDACAEVVRRVCLRDFCSFGEIAGLEEK